MECELLDKCGFFKKYMGSREAACKGLISMYCQGRQNERLPKEGIPQSPRGAARRHHAAQRQNPAQLTPSGRSGARKMAGAGREVRSFLPPHHLLDACHGERCLGSGW